MSEENSNDPVLTGDEKDALLEGVENGDVEVQSNDGPRYATVVNFEIAPRNRIVTNSFPRLQSINRKLAGHIAKTASKLLNEKVEVAPGPLTISTWAEFCEQAAEVGLIYEFRPQPLVGNAVVFVQNSVVAHIVEKFYGGSLENPPRHKADGFTPGEMNVTSLFCDGAVQGIVEHWHGLIELTPETGGIYQSTDIVEIIENSASVISSEFDIHFADEQFYFHIVWPSTTLTTLQPVLEGQKRDRDPAEDERWERVIRARLPDAPIGISTRIGKASLSLREVACLQAGDVIDVNNPRLGTVFADAVPVLEGRFGVHDGCYALEATHWLTAAQATQ
jgi:flagellar motor switch protein FliM